MKDASNIVAADLSTPERILLFCLASGTEWAEAGVTGATVTSMLVRGLVDRRCGPACADARWPRGAGRAAGRLVPRFDRPIEPITLVNMREMAGRRRSGMGFGSVECAVCSSLCSTSPWCWSALVSR
jgi:hypothetical protein